MDGSADYADPQKEYLLSQRRQSFRLCLAIHAPRRGVVEVGVSLLACKFAALVTGYVCF